MGEPQQQGQPQQPMMLAKCAKEGCGKDMYLKQPVLRVVNWPEASAIIFAHEKPQLCASCGTGYVPVIKGFTSGGAIDIQWASIEYQQNPIIAPTPQQMQAVEASKGLVMP